MRIKRFRCEFFHHNLFQQLHEQLRYQSNLRRVCIYFWMQSIYIWNVFYG
jgi:hypothetical protein